MSVVRTAAATRGRGSSSLWVSYGSFSVICNFQIYPTTEAVSLTKVQPVQSCRLSNPGAIALKPYAPRQVFNSEGNSL